MLPSLVPKADTDAIVLIFGYNVRERRIFHVEFVFLRNRIDNRGMPMPVIVLLVIIVALVNLAGGSAAFGRWAEKNIHTRVGAQLEPFILGILIFNDAYFS